MTRRDGQGTARVIQIHRAVPWRTNPHPVFAILVLMALIVGIAVGLFIGPQHGTDTPPVPSYTQSTTWRGTP